jgi:hypothetical protein
VSRVNGRLRGPDSGPNDPILPFDRDPPDVGDEPSRPRRRRLAVIALVLAAALLLAATSLFWLLISPGGRSAGAGVRLGDCLVFDATGPGGRGSGGSTYRPAECSDAAAEFRLLAVTADRDSCVDLPGVTRAYAEGGRVYCIGQKDADPATALNGIAAGDCVAIDAGRPVRDGCEGGTLPVLAVVKDVPKSAGESRDGLFAVCERTGATDVRQTYAWGIGAADGAQGSTWDRLLCLGAAGT